VQRANDHAPGQISQPAPLGRKKVRTDRELPRSAIFDKLLWAARTGSTPAAVVRSRQKPKEIVAPITKGFLMFVEVPRLLASRAKSKPRSGLASQK